MFSYLDKINKIEASFTKGCFLLDVNESEESFKSKTKRYNKKGSYEKFKIFVLSLNLVQDVKSEANEITGKREKVNATKPESVDVGDIPKPKTKRVRRANKQKES